MKTVEIFRTDITQPFIAQKLIESLLELLPNCRINFDLQDCDHILRIESTEDFCTDTVQAHLQQRGYFAELLF